MDDEGGPIHAISPDSANTVRYVLYSAPIGEGGGNSGLGGMREAGIRPKWLVVGLPSAVIGQGGCSCMRV